MCVGWLWVARTHSFPLVAEGLHAETEGGVEEVTAIEAHRRVVAPRPVEALLVKLAGVDWQTHFDDPKRAEWHASKMASKRSRPAKHLALLGESALLSQVTHLVHDP